MTAPGARLRTFTLPHGITPSGKGAVSVYFAPRLDAAAFPPRTLADFPDWLSWPTTLKDLLKPTALEILVDGVAVTWAVVSDPEPDLAVWQALFPSHLRVTSPDVDRPSFQGTRFPERDFADRLTALYADLALTYPQRPPSAAAFLGRPATQGLFTNAGALGQVAQQTRDFLGAGDGTGPGNTDDGEDPAAWDFHQWVSMLGQFPELLRLLGIVVDFEISPPSLPLPGLVKYAETRTSYPILVPGRQEEPVTTTYGRDFWWATCDPDDNAGGFLTLGNGLWSAIDIDPLQSIQTLAGFSRELLEDGNREARVPALYENGWSLVRDEAADRQDRKLRASHQLQLAIRSGLTGPEHTVCSDHVTLGYRLDVRVDGGPWRSLHQRTVTAPSTAIPTQPFQIGPPPTALGRKGAGKAIEHTPADDEGWITTTIISTESPNAGVLRDQLVRWDGWSLTVNAYGTLVDPSTGELVPSAEAEADPSSPVQFTVDHAVPAGTLPALQYGRAYEFRVRLVDLSGVSKPLSAVEPSLAVLGPVRYGRWFPVGAPTVLRRTPRPTPGFGDMPLTMVITSELGQDPATVTQTDRLFFPPDTAWKTCELHREPAGGHAPGAYSELTERDALGLTDQTDVHPTTGELIAAGATSQEVDFLTDPATNGIGLQGLPNAPRLVSVPYGSKAWPDRATARVVLKAGAQNRSQSGRGEVTVTLAPAEQRRVTVGSTLASDKLADFGLYQQLVEGGLAGRALARIRNAILGGQHWLFSGQRELNIVHAVRLPLVLPVITETLVQREIGDQTATIRLRYELDVKSSREVSAYARWSEPLDLLGEAAPTTVDGAIAIAASARLAYEDAADLVPVTGTVDFFNTKRRDLLIDAEVLARFSRYFTEAKQVSFGPDIQVLHPDGVSPTTVRVVDATTDARYRRGVDFDLEGTDNLQLVRLPAGSIPANGVVDVTYVPLPIARRTDDEGAAPFPLVVPSSVKPAPLQIEDALLAVKRTQTVTATSSTVEHDGQQVRLWLSRPWFSSGVGELVGVVTDRVLGGVPATTIIARDVVNPSADVTSPVAGNFGNRSHTLVGIGPGPEPVDGFGPWTVLGHDVAYHEESGRWRCDIGVQTAPANQIGYRPFVRLHVCRFQPESVNGVWTSAVQELDPLQLGVKRTIAATFDDLSAFDFDINVLVTGTGHDPVVTNVTGNERTNVITASIQEADPSIADDDLRWQTVAGTEVELTRTIDSSQPAGSRFFKWATGSNRLDFTFADGTGLDYRIIVEETQPTFRRTDADTGVLETTVPVMTEVVPLPTALQTKIN